MFRYYGRSITQESDMIDIMSVISIVAKVICHDYTTDSLCDKLVNQRKEFSASFNELKREAPNRYE